MLGTFAPKKIRELQLFMDVLFCLVILFKILRESAKYDERRYKDYNHKNRDSDIEFNFGQFECYFSKNYIKRRMR
jgi:hypothetical protein